MGENAMQEPEVLQLLDSDECEDLYSVRIFTGDVISVIVTSDGTELFNDDWQGKQPQTLQEVREGAWRWYRGEEIDF
jgi:hypothetical protein